MPYISCLACGCGRDLPPNRSLLLGDHAADCSTRISLVRGERWYCTCIGPYCDDCCDGRFYAPKEYADLVATLGDPHA